MGFQRLNLRVYGYRFFNLNTMVMNLVLAIIPVLLLIILMAFFKMSGDKSSVISLVVTMLIAFFGFHFPVRRFAVFFSVRCIESCFSYSDYYFDGDIQL